MKTTRRTVLGAPAIALGASAIPVAASAFPRELTVKLHDMFASIGGKRGLAKNQMSACLDEVDIDPMFIDEIKATIFYETAAEHHVKLLVEARNVISPKRMSSYKQKENYLSKLILNVDAGRAVVFVSPTALTILQTEDDSLKRASRDQNAITPPMFRVGTLENDEKVFEVFCDQYASDRTPVLITEPGWFNFEYKNGVTPEASIAKPSLLMTHSDFVTMINAEKLNGVAMDSEVSF